MKKNNLALPFILTFGILGILLGILLLAIDFSKLLSVIFIIIGIFILIANLPSFIFSVTSGNVGGIITSALPILAGALMIFWHNSVLIYLIGIYLLILPILRILLSKDKSLSLRIELPRLILGVILLLIGPATAVDVLFEVAGYVVIALSVLFTVIGIIRTLKTN
jgi:hypothetical protein